MSLCPHRAAVVLLCLCCPAFAYSQPVRSAAEQLWQRGQAAVERGDLHDAERLYSQSLVADPTLFRSHLSLASICLGRDDLDGACTHLARYLHAQPEQRLIRMRFGDVLMRAKRFGEARTQFERCIADTQDQAGSTGGPLIHCHRRLMEIAELQNDAYSEHLHRGVGLYVLARERATVTDENRQLPVEGVLFKAAAELNLAQAERAQDVRVCWYLYEVWNQLGQRQAALRWLRAADAAGPTAALTPAEQGRLHLACQRLRWDESVVRPPLVK